MFGRIGQRLVERMCIEFGSDPGELVCAVGPCICEKCFQVDKELGIGFAREFDCPDITRPDPNDPDKGYVSLHAAAVIQLTDAGVDPSKVSLMRLCTLEQKDLFYSYRRDGKNTGSMAAFLTLE
jgi:copper oxidase (laccase) domain-containing protein